MSDDLDTLNQRFGLPFLRFDAGTGGLPVADIDTPLARARVALQGAHLLDWQPVGQQPVLWVSKAAVFETGKAVRGGVPVCWPWFGARDGLPAHGFVRTRPWQVRGTALDAWGQVVLRLGLVDDASTRALWNFAFDLELVVTVGSSLSLALTTRNTGTAPLTLTQALHSYFCVSDITRTQVQGLDGCVYLDKLKDFAARTQAGPVALIGETDRIYVDTAATCEIDDVAGQRRIQVAKQGSASTVVWNPWREREQSLADMDEGGYKGMVCVETCNVATNFIRLDAHAQHTLAATISVANSTE